MSDTASIPAAPSSYGPLHGVRVLDLSRVLAGPWATQTLADLGAEVIKIERPGAGDDTRHWGPPFTTTADGQPGDAAYFLCANRGKKSVELDIASPEGAEAVRRLAATCDVVVENFKTGGLKKYGLDYASLAAVNPKLVYCSITGFGQDGPDAHRAGYDYMIQAMGGLMSITGQPDGAPGAEPMKVGVAVVDLFTGLYASNAILAALWHARASGEGQHVDIALFDVQAAMLANQATNYFVSGKAPTRMGNAHPNLAPYQPFPCSDGMVIIAVGNDGQFRALCGALGLEVEDRFTTNALRVANREALGPLIAAQTEGFTMQGLMQALEAAGVPCGPVNTIDQVFEEPQAIHRGLTVEQTRPDLADPVRTVASPIRLSKTPVRYDAPPPKLGQDTEAVLGALKTER
ncbi:MULTISPECIES: CaiB/BaiF CoA transferase family protein [Brevundimonas]|uniref:CaiB/BaiF CoA transferase family protein n=1 Tax=Brevundimonas TaxID=41275 RepID=UPI00190893CC|nr:MULTISPECIES: CaiB/BaiF CoA-transferase family protein [Brevundimonas]MDA0744346.1 CaiB/BaiF CoA-transferase family protein [Pseudomonadota bacterium]MBK1969552.1 CoA transferase [Brevundimonas diminuta]MBK1974876.1 CoA transferase [Brevundimonas diminuta]MDA1321669.1 CaiB/BaiF CoA-transferase family protein [Pseudomonadota bacterium]MDM8352670.1 CaiB/BaiF CoA-transferase family protein [Brevundimonas diminuta]